MSGLPPRGLGPPVGVALLFVMLLAVAIGATGALPVLAVAAPAADTSPCPTRASPAVGPNFAAQQIVHRNFSHQDLTNANFAGATITGSMFLHTTLAGADFSGATIKLDSIATDFSFADLTSACFKGTTFDGTTYFTYATLTCTNYSSTDLSNNVVFGDGGLTFNAQACRPAFRNATLNCEFFAQWNALDISGANIAACNALIKPGHDFGGGQMAGVVFDGMDLTGSRWQGTVLENASFVGATLDNATGLAGSSGAPARLAGARFNNASVRNVDFSNAQLYGANFTRANLENSRLQGALLTNNPGGSPPIAAASSFDNANLKNVDLSGAKLDSASFRSANFYGSFNVLAHGPPAGFPCQTETKSCGTTGVTGFTCSCATARGADLTRADFNGAFLYGTDFGGTGTKINGTDFSGAVLVAANFNGASFAVDTQGGAPPKFGGAFLQGADFTGAALNNTPLTNAFIDFRSAGNQMQLLLDGKHTTFRGWKAQSAQVCVQADYSLFVTKLPMTTSTMTCPDGNTYASGCGMPASSRWRSPIDIATNDPPGYYVNNPTFGKANQNASCNAQTVDSNW
ncbi:MAG: pentapeptide repeat-containing protein [Burkholderiaceae bacterium]